MKLKKRMAELELKSTQITLTPSRKLSQVIKENVILNLVEITEVVNEIGNQDDYEKLHWILVTSLNVENFQDAKNIAHVYTLRWKIEEYFKVLKSGCAVEKCRLNESEKLKKYLALFSIIAWRLFWMTLIQRVSPELSAEYVLSGKEWKLLYSKYSKEAEPPSSPPTVKEVFTWIAQLGGYLNRNSDGPPGTTSIWRGWSRLQDMVLGNRFNTTFQLVGKS